MNEIGIDSLSLADFIPLTQTMVDQISYMIQKNGYSSAGGSEVGQSSYFHQTFTPYRYFEQNVQLMQQNNKPIGAYFFSFAWDYASARYEAELECDALNACTYKPDWPVFIDWEAVSRQAVVNAGFPITSARLSDIVHGWADGVRSKGFIPGFYTGAAIARDDFGSSLIQSLRAEGIYFWEAHYGVPQPYVVPYDIWQYDDNDTWIDGAVVDWNRIGDDRMWDIGGKKIPIWLQLYLAQRSENNGCTILL